MRAMQTPPAGYVPTGSVTIDRNRPLAIWLNIASIPWAVVCGTGFVYVSALLRPQWRGFELRSVLPAGPLPITVLTGCLLLAIAVSIVVHEAVHGLGFWAFTRSRPVFGFKGWYAYASAPGWYLSRSQFVAVGMAPLVVLSVLGLGLIAVLPPSVAAWLMVAVIVNAGSAVGDLYLCARVLAAPASAVIEDQPHGIAWWVPQTGPVLEDRQTVGSSAFVRRPQPAPRTL